MTRHIAYSVAVLEENEEYTSTSSLMAGMHAVVRIFPKIFPFRFDMESPVQEMQGASANALPRIRSLLHASRKLLEPIVGQSTS